MSSIEGVRGSEEVGNAEGVSPIAEIPETDMDPNREDESKRYEQSRAEYEDEQAGENMSHVTEKVVESENSELESEHKPKSDAELEKELRDRLSRSRFGNIRG